MTRPLWIALGIVLCLAPGALGCRRTLPVAVVPLRRTPPDGGARSGTVPGFGCVSTRPAPTTRRLSFVADLLARDRSMDGGVSIDDCTTASLYGAGQPYCAPGQCQSLQRRCYEIDLTAVAGDLDGIEQTIDTFLQSIDGDVLFRSADARPHMTRIALTTQPCSTLVGGAPPALDTDQVVGCALSCAATLGIGDVRSQLPGAQQPSMDPTACRMAVRVCAQTGAFP